MSVTTHPTHWARPDTARDLLAIARTPGLAPPSVIHVRPELYARLLAQSDPATRAALGSQHALGDGAGIPLVVDPSLPSFPGFEVHRAGPGAPGRPHAAAA